MGETFPTVRAAVVQSAAAVMDREAGTEKACRLIAEAASQGAGLVVFPEAFIPAYPWGLRFGTHVGGRTTQSRRAWARMSMYAKGVEVYVAATADSRDSWQTTIRHIACEGRCFVLSACQYLTRAMYPADFEAADEIADAPEVLSRGGSAIVGPLGDYMAEPLFGHEGVLLADLDLAQVVQARFDLDVTGHYARPDVFRLLANERPAPPVQADRWGAESPPIAPASGDEP